MSGNGKTFERARARHRTLERSYVTLKATLRSVQMQSEEYLAECPEPMRAQFAWFHQNLSDAFVAINRPKLPEPTTRDQRELKSLAEEMGFGK